LIQIILIMSLLSVLWNREIGYCDPISLNEWQEQVVEEGLSNLLTFFFEINFNYITV
jgi:hypothetical protein